MREKLSSFKEIFKSVFFISVLILVIIQFRKISKEIKVDDIKYIFSNLSIITLLLMGIYGIFANIPASLYDFIFNNEIGNDYDKKYIGETGFCINNFNDLLGLGGFISIGLRSAFYGKGHEPTKLMKKIFELLVFLPCGLSFFSIISLISIGFHSNPGLEKYMFLLIGASFYLPVVIGISFFGKIRFSKKNQFKLFLISIAEWFGVMSCFVVIGILMGVKFDILTLSTLVVAANIVGYISMIPGAIGSFDLIILFALKSQGIDQELALCWILLYRLFYYIVPFFLAFVFFTKNFSKAFEFRESDFVKKLVKNILLVIDAALMYIFGLFMILAATLPDKAYGGGILTKLNPIRASAIYQFPSMLFGFIFIILARAYISRQKKSFALNNIVMILVFFYTYVTGYSHSTLIYILIMFVINLLTKDELYTKQFIYASEDRFIDLFLANFMLVVYVWKILKHGSIIDVNISEANDFILIPFEYSFISIIVTISIIYFISYLLVIFLRGKKIKIGEKYDFDRYIDLLRNQGGSKVAFLSFLDDKDLYWFSKDSKDLACLQIRTVADKVIVMGDPIGNEEYFNELLDKFINEADNLGYNIVFYEINKDITMKVHEYGFNFMKFGESANVNLDEFNLDGKKKKNLRKTINKISRDGYTFEVMKGPFDGKTIKRLQEISNSWLGDSKEKGFSLGFFDKDYLNIGDIGLVKDPDGKIIAFANLCPIYYKNWATIDLMRYEENVDGLMDYLFINIFSYLKENNIKYFDLGMAPLSNVGVMRHSFLQEKMVYTIFKLGDHYYSFEGLKAYKDKYASFWEERYLSYSKGSSLIFSALSLFYTINKKVK
ncbi:MAG: bifunctional lysylphosphatidylglycerol flippase/synthetase MprF [Anaerococcus sp.]|nr:bifunctional lysylphosphatidylglycerol flippase/synthetase MprF [Anaerococcus sp.]